LHFRLCISLLIWQELNSTAVLLHLFNNQGQTTNIVEANASHHCEFFSGALMKTHHFASPEISLDFDAAIRRAAEVADDLLGENMLLSWYDRERDLESPAHASECHEGCPTKEFWDYALNRGGRWR
jgi:hypothetical protein